MQSGTPEEIYSSPKNPFVANFIGMTNFIEGKVAGQRTVNIKNIKLGIDCHGFSKGDKVKLAARPENIQIIKRKIKRVYLLVKLSISNSSELFYVYILKLPSCQTN